MDYKKEFRDYSTKHLRMSGTFVDDVMKDQIESMTPYILEERSLNVSQLDIFSRLMKDRILWVSGTVNQNMSDIVQAQLLFLDNVEKKDITMYLNSGGGSVSSGLSMIDVMTYVSSDISTVNLGLCASMGSLLLGAGTKGKRSSLRFSKTMLHQSSGSAGGNIQEARVTFVEWEKTNKILFELLASFCGKTPESILEDTINDKWLTSEETLDYGLIDEIIINRR